MTREEKTLQIQTLKDKFSNSQFFYITDSSTLSVEKINQFRRLCFDKKALEGLENDSVYAPIYKSLVGPTSILFTDNAKAPAHLLEEFRKTNERPILKAAYIDSDVFFGDDQIKILVKLKSKEELLGEVIMILQSPATRVIGALKSGGSTIAGLVKALEERAPSFTQ